MTQLTEKQVQILTIIAESSSDSCGSFEDEENMSYNNAKDLAEETGMKLQAIGGVMSSLTEIFLISDTGESARGDRLNDFVGNPQVYLDYPQVAHLVTHNY